MTVIETTWGNLSKFPWQALFACADEYKRENPSHNNDYYTEYLKQTWGIDHKAEHIRIVDEQKYMLFLLKWS
jgi:hypothetical protein